ncbi:FYN-binding protein 1 isoform X1 [Xiphophorus maculatus]|uniref:FYN binding protein 1 n=1 Tax=Xiphophorus maculatus TaxID=8083 RepID=M3ZN44_XIPMA|nr:FYN-binding protein 1 isoform X1 [Xiphophorus maculatus]
MANKTDVKAMMARFQAGGASIDDSTPVGRPKASLQPTLSSGPAIQKKSVLESLSGSAINSTHKPPFPKNTPLIKSDSDTHEPNKAKALANKFANSLDDTATNRPPILNKVQTPLKPPFSQATEAKGSIQKPPFNKPPLNSTLPETKPAFPKPPGALNSKPNRMKEDSGGGTTPNTGPTTPKTPNLHQKPPSNVLKMWQQNEEQSETKTDTVNKPSSQAFTAPKPPTNFKNAQSLFNKEKDPSEQTESGGVNKPPFTAINSTPPQKPPAHKKPSLKKPSKVPAQADGINGDIPPGLKRNPLPNSLALGPPPAKPNRPPKVDLDGFKKSAETREDGPGFKKPPPLAPNSQTNHAPQIQAPPTLPPVLPARHVAMNQSDDMPPPPPPVFSHPSQRAKEENDDEDEEVYEDVEERWDQEKKKDDKEEKRRLEATKKEQKEREKKEQEARKKFKLTGALEVIQKGKALTDCKGSKMDLALKQGDQLDIVRVQGNPEGKWLARTTDGTIGYVKTTSVEIDFNSLKNRPAQPAHEPEIYDDIDVVSADNGGVKGPAVVLPPPPGEDGEIYDDVVDPNLEVSSLENQPSPARTRSILRIFDRNRRSPSSKVLPAPDQFAAAGNAVPAAPIDEEIYDDVDSQNAPPPPPISSLPGMKGKNKAEDMDPKKQKKFEKEEKEFRKKFKYDGEIQVLYQVTIISPLNNKKWSGKDLPLKAGEKLDVIVKAQDDKLVCRNDEGKFGYVSTGHVVDDGEIYDDIGGDDCIYDND